jgi:hypothetical protein
MRRLRHSGEACAIAALVACSGALAAAAPGDRPLRFSTVERESRPEQAPVSMTFAVATVADRRSRDPLERPDRANPVDYRKFAAVYVAVVRPTAGYSVTIKRLTLQRRSRFAQVCARAAVAPPPPDRLVAQVKTRSWHFVKIARGSFGATVPRAIVLRDANDRLLYARPAARARLCR